MHGRRAASQQVGECGAEYRGGPTSAPGRLAAHTRELEAVPDDATPAQRLVAAVTYFGVFALLVTGVHLVFPLLPHAP